MSETKRDLVETLQRLYDSEIHCTITWLWDGGIEFALIPMMAIEDSSKDEWTHIEKIESLADAVHARAMEAFPESTYALGADEFNRRHPEA